mgnify:CR=1 FL=1
MKYKDFDKIQYIILLCITLFTVLSIFTCYEYWYKYAENPVYIGNNCFLGMLLIGILEIYCVFQNTYKKQRKTILFCVIRVMITFWILILKFIGDEVFGMIGNSGEYSITVIGYIVIILSWMILGLEITQTHLMKKGHMK